MSGVVVVMVVVVVDAVAVYWKCVISKVKKEVLM